MWEIWMKTVKLKKTTCKIKIPGINYDKWQLDVLGTKGNIVLCSGRQVGKSTVIAKDAGDFAANNPNVSVMIIASVERQAQELFSKTLYYLEDNYKSYIKKGKDRPTLSKVKLNNGSIIRCLPTGLDGHGIRGYTIDRLYADEAAFIPEAVWEAITPMLLTTGGDIILLSTPHGNSGYFHRAFNDETFTKFQISSETVVKEREITDTWTEYQRTKAIEHLEREKERMTVNQYLQEYMGKFIDSTRQVFSDKLIKKCMQLKRPGVIARDHKYYLGVDIARMGADESTFEVIDRTNPKLLKQVENLITRETLTTQTTRQILQMEQQYLFSQIFVDDGGMGVGVFDQLLEDESTRRKVVAINNTSRPLTRDEKQKKRVLKEDIYNNLLMLMERGEILLLDDPEIFQSLKSVQYDLVKNTVKYFGNYTHIADGLVRAAWAVKSKKLDIYVY